jgi:hypothetical protein
MIGANRYTVSAQTLALLLLVFVTPAASADAEIAVLTIRRDNIRKVTTSELLPIAKVARGRFSAIEGVEDLENSACAPTTFRGWSQTGVSYDVLYRGVAIGTAKALERERGGYSCSELCVVRAATSLKEKAPGVEGQRTGFDPSGSFDESITQYVAYSTTDGKRPYSTRMTTPLTSADRRALQAFAKARIVRDHRKESTGRVEMDSVEPFIGSKAGDVNVFVSAVVTSPDGELRALSAIVKQVAHGKVDSMFELLEDGDEDRGAASYELLDAADFDGDGVTELLVIYHNYEFHEFQVLKRIGSKFEIVHKGPSYGC